MKRKKKKTSLKSKHILIIMTILCLGMIVFGLSRFSSLGPVHSVAGYLVAPFQKGMSTVGKLVHGTTLDFGDAKALSKENKALKEKVNTLTEQNNLLLQDQDKLERLAETVCIGHRIFRI